MSEPHPRLVRQLERLAVSPELTATPVWTALLATVSATYHEADRERAMLERAMTVSSREMRELHDELARSHSTQLDQQREKLLATDAVKDAVIAASTDGILVIDDARRVALCNRRFAEIWKIPEDVFASGDDHQLLGAAISQLVHPEAFLAGVEALYGNPTAHSQDEIELRDGTILERYSRPAIDANQVVRGRLWVFRDVTTVRRDVARLREAHAFLDSILETLPSMVFVKDAAELRFVRFNRAGEQLLGVSRQSLLGRRDHDLFPLDQAEAFTAKDREVLAQTSSVTIAEEEIQTMTGPRRLRTRKVAIFGADDRPAYLLGISEDITDELARSADLYLAKDRAESATRAKSDFLLNMSHELRTPLNAILGFSRVLGRVARDRLTSDELGYLSDIVAAGEHMLRLINDLLDLRSLEAMALDVGPVALLPPLDEAVRMVLPLARERSQELVVDAPADLPPCIGERRALVQVLVNLLTNAAKFTPVNGRLEIRARGDATGITLHVTDNGIGIGVEDQARLFQYFEQLGAKHAHHMKGSGVGLALTRALVEKMGGTISVASVLGEGTTFEIRLRAA